MKKYKGIIAVLMVFVIICSFAACKSQGGSEDTSEITQAVTDADGEPVTDESGEVVTEAVQGEAVTDKNGEAVTEVVTSKNGEAVTNSKGQSVTQVVTAASSASGKTTTKSNSTTKAGSTAKADDKGTTATTKKPITKPSKPADVSSLKASSVEADSIKLTWSKVDCTGYQIQMSSDGGMNWTYLEKSYTKGTTYTVKDLNSLTEYRFRVRAYNKNTAGTTASKWTQLTVTTSASETAKKLTITILLPNDNGKEDTLTIKIDGKTVHTATVKCNGSQYVYTTEEKYKGAVNIAASLKNGNVSHSINTDKDAKIDLSVRGIDVLEGEDD